MSAMWGKRIRYGLYLLLDDENFGLVTYVVNVLFDNDKRRMVNQSFVIKVQ